MRITSNRPNGMTEKVSNEVWDVLEEVIKDHPVLLNRAPDTAQTWYSGFPADFGGR